MIFWKLFYTFCKIGIFNFGGGYAMIALIQNEVVEKQGWMTMAEFTDIVATSQVTPGPIGINGRLHRSSKRRLRPDLGCRGRISRLLFRHIAAAYPDVAHQQIPPGPQGQSYFENGYVGTETDGHRIDCRRCRTVGQLRDVRHVCGEPVAVFFKYRTVRRRLHRLIEVEVKSDSTDCDCGSDRDYRILCGVSPIETSRIVFIKETP